jgi:hypothetical protein
MPGEPPWHLVSLLGHKCNGLSEYSFYDFRASCEPDDGRPTFQAYLDRIDEPGSSVVHEFRTVDYQPVRVPMLMEISERIWDLLQGGLTVIVFDSGGMSRVGQVRKRLAFADPLS